MKEKYTTEQLVQRWEDRREVKNVMGKYVVSLLIKKETDMLDELWSRREDVCLGINEGWFNGREAVAGYYEALDQRNIAVRDLLTVLYPEQVKGRGKEELYGIGVFDLRSTTNTVIEIAGDGETAKLMCHCFGKPVDVNEYGPLSYWILGTFCMDCVREDGGWKIWHLMYLEDVHAPTGVNWSMGKHPYPELAEFAPLKNVKKPEPNVKATLREYYSVDRPPTKLPPIPAPYDSFAKTFSYGM